MSSMCNISMEIKMIKEKMFYIGFLVGMIASFSAVFITCSIYKPYFLVGIDDSVTVKVFALTSSQSLCHQKMVEIMNKGPQPYYLQCAPKVDSYGD